MAAAAPSDTDALGLLSAALNSASKEDESQHLTQLYSLLKRQPGNIPILLPSLISLLPKASSSIRTWIADVMDLAFCRPSLSLDTRNTLAIHAPDAILHLVQQKDPKLAKIAVQCFASMYPALFRLVCNDRSKALLWQTVQSIKAQIVYLFDSGSRGVRVSAVKGYQRIIQVQSRSGTGSSSSDPRAQPKGDVSIAILPSSHPFLQAAQLEDEANRLFTQLVTLVFTSDVPDLVMAAVNALTLIAKSRPHLCTIILRAMASWTPASLGNLSHTQVRNVEKTIRIFYIHFIRNQLAGAEIGALQKSLEAQQRRMEEAAKAYNQQKEAEAKRKRQQIDQELESPKRIKLEHATQASAQATAAAAATTAAGSASTQSAGEAFMNASVRSAGGVDVNPLAAFDVKTLPINLVIDLILANLQALSETELHAAIDRMRQSLGPDAAFTQQPASPAVAGPSQPHQPQPAPSPALDQNGFNAAVRVKAEDATTEGDGATAAASADDDVPQDPLKMDIAEEEDFDKLADSAALEGTRENYGSRRDDNDGRDQEEEEDEDLSLAVIENFALEPPEYLSLSESDALIKDTINRICEFGTSTANVAAAVAAAANKAEPDSQALWSTLVIRLATRGFAEPIDPESGSEGRPVGVDTPASLATSTPNRTLAAQANIIRSMMLEFVRADFSRRTRFAVAWMAEEWFCDRLRRKDSLATPDTSYYAVWLVKLVQAWIPTVDAKDRALASFLSHLPEIPPAVMDQIATLSRDKQRMVAGLSTLQDICITRPPLRDQAARKLLLLTRTSERATRAKAIRAIKQCATSNSTLEHMILSFARSNLDLLIETPEKSGGGQAGTETEPLAANKARDSGTTANGADQPPTNDDNDTEGAVKAPEEESKYPVDQDDVLRFVELPFSLCTKIPDMLDEIFHAYPRTPAFVREAIEKHITDLVRALGSRHQRLLTLLRNFPPGTDALALCILKTLTEKNRAPAVVTLVKELMEARPDADPRFLVPIMADLDKAEIMKRLPKVVTILSSRQSEDKALIKSVFQSIVQMPPQGFGSVSSNLPRVRQTELLTPVELMGLLHRAEDETGPENARVAIQICFSMTDVYRSEVLAAVMNQLSEDPHLPMLFMRTVIMAVSTYKSLASYVAKNLLSRLITKKIWQNPPLWTGFILCAKQTAPSSFGALIQLPKDQLREVVNRQPDLRTGLVEYLTARAGGNRARLATFMDLLGPAPDAEERVNANGSSSAQQSSRATSEARSNTST
ncbi:hypothetical protein BCV70DRAFT_160633 [Testicularia cyperi]|uniref:Symplekin n=1 Tax=Testicularia cyperi TaxID=1882483 RepID=A0A317XQ46_9BASI|nr:hypothetical protein BCV70DRAFT_160633 [Testicularia cyperi]